MDTARICTEAGFRFYRLRAGIDWISTVASSLENESQSAVSLRMAQRIACSLQRENARAVLRRQACRDDDDEAPAVVAAQVDALMWQ